MVSGVWCVMLGVWYVVFGIGVGVGIGIGIWYLVCHLVSGIWYLDLVSGSW
jgi:hypothetical protein